MFDVIVAGAGPVGLFLACELALAKCSVLLLEKDADPHAPLKKLPFGVRGLSALSVEILDRRGLLGELAVPQRMKNPFSSAVQALSSRRQAGHFAGLPVYSDKIDAGQWQYRLPSATDTVMLAEMAELETVLMRRALELGVEIKRGHSVSDVRQMEDGVIVQTEQQSFQARWLVGCDGSRSAVRKAGGFDFAGTEPEFTGYSAHVDLADPEKLAPGRNLTPTGLYFQMHPGVFAMQEFDGGAGHNGAAVTVDRLQAVLRRVSGTDVTVQAVHIASTWTDRARQATQYRNGRILLAGDAAHIHAPLGGQGLNLGLGDAMNLGWKLAVVIRREATQALLDTYQAERHPVGAQVLEWSRAQVALMRPDAGTRALRAVVGDLIDTGDGATYIAGRVRGVLTHYQLDGAHPLVGYSVPNFELEEGVTVGELMRDGRAMLLDFEGHASLEDLARAYGGRIKYVSGRAKERAGISAVLVRPDGCVIWACGDNLDVAEAAHAAARWFAPAPV